MKKFTSKIDVPEVKGKVDECVPIRTHINKILWKQMKDEMHKIVKLSGCEKKQQRSLMNFAYVVRRAIYYRGGWPFSTSRGVIQSKAEDLAGIVVFLKATGYEDLLTEVLEDAGITNIEVDDKIFKNVLNSPGMEKNREEIHECFDNTMLIQREICQAADSINIEAFNTLSPEITKSKENPTGLSAVDFSELVCKTAANKSKEPIVENIMVTKTSRDNYGVYVNNLLKK